MAWLRMPTTYLSAMMTWRSRIQAEEQLVAGTVAMVPYMEKDDRVRWSNTLVREAQGGRKAMPSQVLKGPRENPPATFGGLAVIVEKADRPSRHTSDTAVENRE